MSPLCFCQLYSLYDSQSNKKTLHLYLYWFNQPTNKTDSPKKKNLLKIFFHLFFLVFGYCHSEYLVISIIYHSSFFPKIWLISIFFFISIASYFFDFRNCYHCSKCECVCVWCMMFVCWFIQPSAHLSLMIPDIFTWLCIFMCVCVFACVLFNLIHFIAISFCFKKNKLMC